MKGEDLAPAGATAYVATAGMVGDVCGVVPQAPRTDTSMQCALPPAAEWKCPRWERSQPLCQWKRTVQWTQCIESAALGPLRGVSRVFQ